MANRERYAEQYALILDGNISKFSNHQLQRSAKQPAPAELGVRN